MNSITQYISEKLHLNSNNKGLRPHNDDPTDFIESFADDEEKEWITKLISFCIGENLKHDDDHICYVLERVEAYRGAAPVDRYCWSANMNNSHHDVGETIESTSDISVKIKHFKVLYIVTKNTTLPDKYKEKYL